MNKKTLFTIIAGIIMVMATLMGAKAENLNISMKTNQVYTAYYEVSNKEAQNLKNCIPYMTADLANVTWKGINTQKFDLYQDDTKQLILTFQHPDAGYYVGQLQIHCEYWINNVFTKAGPILNPLYAPTYTLIVSIAGQGQAYAFNSHTYTFIGKEGQIKTANFIIANTGTMPLSTTIKIPPGYENIIDINPLTSTIIPGTTQNYKITVHIPDDFKTMDSNLTINIGDYQDTFIIHGEKETLGTAGAAVQSIGFESTTPIAGYQIPTIPVVLVLIIAGIFLIREERKGTKKYGH